MAQLRMGARDDPRSQEPLAPPGEPMRLPSRGQGLLPVARLDRGPAQEEQRLLVLRIPREQRPSELSGPLRFTLLKKSGCDHSQPGRIRLDLSARRAGPKGQR